MAGPEAGSTKVGDIAGGHSMVVAVEASTDADHSVVESTSTASSLTGLRAAAITIDPLSTQTSIVPGSNRSQEKKRRQSPESNSGSESCHYRRV